MRFALYLGCTVPVRGMNYEIAARKLGIEPRGCAFIDDNPACIKAATEASMSGIVYENLEQVKKALKDLGVAL